MLLAATVNRVGLCRNYDSTDVANTSISNASSYNHHAASADMRPKINGDLVGDRLLRQIDSKMRIHALPPDAPYCGSDMTPVPG